MFGPEEISGPDCSLTLPVQYEGWWSGSGRTTELVAASAPLSSVVYGGEGNQNPPRPWYLEGVLVLAGDDPSSVLHDLHTSDATQLHGASPALLLLERNSSFSETNIWIWSLLGSGYSCRCHGDTNLCPSIVVRQPALGEDKQPLLVVQRRRPLLLLRPFDQRLLQDHLTAHPGLEGPRAGLGRRLSHLDPKQQV